MFVRRLDIHASTVHERADHTALSGSVRSSFGVRGKRFLLRRSEGSGPRHTAGRSGVTGARPHDHFRPRPHCLYASAWATTWSWARVPSGPRVTHTPRVTLQGCDRGGGNVHGPGVWGSGALGHGLRTLAGSGRDHGQVRRHGHGARYRRVDRQAVRVRARRRGDQPERRLIRPQEVELVARRSAST